MDGLWAAFWLGLDSNQARNQGGGHLPPPKFSKHYIAILTFAATFKQ